ncbi:MAG: hypothetical protein ABI597_07085 [Gammaproteobacteria bacterium]
MMNYIRFSLKLATQFFKALGIAILTSCFLTSSAFALSFSLNSTPDLSAMLISLSEAIPDLMRLVTALAYVMGFFFIIKGVMELKHFGESRSMMSQEHSIMKPLSFLGVGAMLLYLPASVQTGLSTFWTDATPYAYVSQATDTWSELTNAVFMMVQLIGTIAFIRGLIILTHVGGGHGGQPGTFAKALAYIISGILCINLYQFLQAVLTTLNIGTLA